MDLICFSIASACVFERQSILRNNFQSLALEVNFLFHLKINGNPVLSQNLRCIQFVCFLCHRNLLIIKNKNNSTDNKNQLAYINYFPFQKELISNVAIYQLLWLDGF